MTVPHRSCQVPGSAHDMGLGPHALARGLLRGAFLLSLKLTVALLLQVEAPLLGLLLQLRIVPLIVEFHKLPPATIGQVLNRLVIGRKSEQVTLKFKTEILLSEYAIRKYSVCTNVQLHNTAMLISRDVMLSCVNRGLIG
jgi:hypothetical protein